MGRSGTCAPSGGFLHLGSKAMTNASQLFSTGFPLGVLRDRIEYAPIIPIFPSLPTCAISINPSEALGPHTFFKIKLKEEINKCQKLLLHIGGWMVKPGIIIFDWFPFRKTILFLKICYFIF